jgi:hypothetical protein
MTPFEIDSIPIEQLGDAYGSFIAALLETEQTAHSMRGHQVTCNKDETTRDRGVDA